MAFEHYIRNGQKRLRCGYTTGTCAALAAQGKSVIEGIEYIDRGYESIERCLSACNARIKRVKS